MRRTAKTQNTDLRQNYAETLGEYNNKIIRHKKKLSLDQKLREAAESIYQNQLWERCNNLNNKKDNLALQNDNILDFYILKNFMSKFHLTILTINTNKLKKNGQSLNQQSKIIRTPLIT